MKTTNKNIKKRLNISKYVFKIVQHFLVFSQLIYTSSPNVLQLIL